MSKTILIDEIRNLLNRDTRPPFLVFRQEQDMQPGTYMFQGKMLTREECAKIPAKTYIFVNRRVQPT